MAATTKRFKMAATTKQDMVANTGLFGNALEKSERKALGFIGFDGKAAEFCPYTEISDNYDKTRVPLGVPITLGFMSDTDVPLGKQDLLDVGAGTGTFVDVVRGKVRTCMGLEYNDGMIKQAEARFQSASNVKFQQGSADALPFEDNTFHAATMNQVSHHFPTDDNYAFLAKTLKEIFRVLKPGGTFVMNHAARDQTVNGLWWTALMPQTCAQYCEQTCPTDLLLKYMADAGFEVTAESCVVPVQGTLMHSEVYLKKYGIEGAFVKEYRDGDSSWVMSETLGELESAQKQIRGMQANGTAEAFLAERERQRNLMGQATFICVRKPQA